MSQANLPHLRRERLPTMYDLPSEVVGEPALPDEFHRFQADLMEKTCQPPTYPADQIFIACDLYLYYDSRHPLWYKRPDWFMVLGAPRSPNQQDLRLSYVIWQEGVAPFMVLELLSPGTENEDLGKTLRDVDKPPTKWEVYEQILRVPYYVIYDRYENHLRSFKLGTRHYEELVLVNDRLWLEELKLGLGLWQGDYEGIYGLWLRWYDAQGDWVPTPQERADQERLRKEQAQQQADQERLQKEQAQQQADQERLQKEQAQQRADQLAAYLKSIGINPEDIAPS